MEKIPKILKYFLNLKILSVQIPFFRKILGYALENVMVKYIQQNNKGTTKNCATNQNKIQLRRKKGGKTHEKNIICSNSIGGFADGSINCTGSSAGSYNVALF